MQVERVELRQLQEGGRDSAREPIVAQVDEVARAAADGGRDGTCSSRGGGGVGETATLALWAYAGGAKKADVFALSAFTRTAFIQSIQRRSDSRTLMGSPVVSEQECGEQAFGRMMTLRRTQMAHPSGGCC